ncbi:MAG TPA: lamin tail domain-containing protein, partial [Solirubrobacteraceae bacterium]
MLVVAGLALAAAISLGGASSGTAAPSSGIVVNEVYGGGGNSGATYTTDFIELRNRGTAAVSLDGWSVQYDSAGATGNWQVTQLTGSIAPGAIYLVAEATGTGGTQPLPTPQATGTTRPTATTTPATSPRAPRRPAPPTSAAVAAAPARATRARCASTTSRTR